MEPKIISLPAFIITGLRITTQGGSLEIPKLWGEFLPRIGEIPHLTGGQVAYGMMGNFTESGGLDYMAGCAVEKVNDLPNGMTTWNVPANTYAVFESTIPTIPGVIDHIFGVWLPASVYRLSDGPQFEYYDENFKNDDPASILYLYIPVKNKS